MPDVTVNKHVEDAVTASHDSFYAGSLLLYSPLFRLWSIEHYRRCSFRCSYCCVDAQGKSSAAFSKEHVLNVLAAELAIAESQYGFDKEDSALVISCFSDPYTYEDAEYGLTRVIIDYLACAGYRFSLVTRSDAVLRDIDILQKYPGQVAVSLSVTVIDQQSVDKLEPHAPPPLARLACAKMLVDAGIDTTIRIDPWIPEVTDIDALLALCPLEAKVLVSPLHVAGTLSGFFAASGHEIENFSTDNYLPHMVKTYLAKGLCRSTKKHFHHLQQADINEAYVQERNRIGFRKNTKWFYPIYPGNSDVDIFYKFLKPEKDLG